MDKLHTTYSSLIFRATFEQAKELAEMCGLELIAYPEKEWEKYQASAYRYSTRSYFAWEDRKYGGGLCRITYQDGMMWISNHSGNYNGQIWEEAAEWAEQIMKLEPVAYETEWDEDRRNPRVYIEYDKSKFYKHEGD